MITERELELEFNDYLYEIYGESSIAGYEYDTSFALRKLDPVAYRESFNNWLDVKLTEGEIVEGNDGNYYTPDEIEELENE